MNEAVTIAAIAALPGVIGAYFAYRQSVKASDKASKAETQKVEAGAYRRAREMYESSIRQLEDQLERVRKQVAEEQNISTKLRNQIYALEITVSRLRTELIRAGVELPVIADEA